MKFLGKHIRARLSENDIRGALDVFYRKVNDPFIRDKLVILKAAHARLQDRALDGTLNFGEVDRYESRIVRNILKLLTIAEKKQKDRHKISIFSNFRRDLIGR